MLTVQQPRFDLQLTEARPLVPLEVAVFKLDQDVDDITNLIATGKLLWAFDVRCERNRQGQPTERSEVRIFWRCLEDYIAGRDQGRDSDKALLAVINEILPPLGSLAAVADLAAVRSSQLARRFACDKKHTINLLAERSLQTAAIKVGPKHSPFIARPSIVQFLINRRIK